MIVKRGKFKLFFLHFQDLGFVFAFLFLSLFVEMIKKFTVKITLPDLNLTLCSSLLLENFTNLKPSNYLLTCLKTL